MKWKTSEFLRLSGATPRTLRYYEEKKAILPERNQENAYHLYSEQDLIMLWETRSLNSIGFSIEDIAYWRENTHPEDIIDSLTEMQHSLDDQILSLERRLRTVTSTKHRYEMLRDSPSEVTKYQYHGIYRLLISNQEIISHPDFDETIRKWTSAIPETKLTLVIDHTQLNGEPDHLLPVQIGLGISRRHAEEINLPTKAPVRLFERSSGGMCSLVLSDPTKIRESHLKLLLDHAASLNKEIAGDFHARLSHISMENGEPRFHFFMHSVLA